MNAPPAVLPLQPAVRRRRALIGSAGVAALLAFALAAHRPAATPTLRDTPPATLGAQPPALAVSADPDEALAAALVETDPARRSLALAAALRSRAQHDAPAAAAWVETHAPLLDVADAMTEIFAAFPAPPRDAVALAERIARAAPALARDSGYGLIFGLNRRGEFPLSASYATAAPAEIRRDLVIAAYHDWSRQQPELALLAAAQLTEPSAREIALQAALSGWARADPESLAATALGFPDGAEKTAALTKAVRSWVIQEPAKAGAWILAHRETLPAAEAALRDD